MPIFPTSTAARGEKSRRVMRSAFRVESESAGGAGGAAIGLMTRTPPESEGWTFRRAAAVEDSKVFAVEEVRAGDPNTVTRA